MEGSVVGLPIFPLDETHVVDSGKPARGSDVVQKRVRVRKHGIIARCELEYRHGVSVKQ